MRYQRPRWNSSRYGSTVRSSSRYAGAPGGGWPRRRTGGPGSGRPGSGADVDAQVPGPLGDEPAQLQQPLGGRQALDLHRRRGQVERRQLLGGEARDRGGRTPPAGSGSRRPRGATPGTGSTRSGMPMARSSSLSRSKARRNAALSSGYSSCAWISVAGQRTARVEQERGQVEEALQLLPRHAADPILQRARAASAPAAGRVARKKQRVLVGTAAHRGDVQPEGRRGGRRRRAVDDAHVVAGVLEGAVGGRGDEHRRAGGVERGARVVAHAPVSRSRVAVGHAQHRDGRATERRGGVEDGRHLERAWCRAARRCRRRQVPSPRSTASARATWRASASARRDRHRLEVAPERVPGGDGHVDEPGLRAWRGRGREMAIGSAAPSVIT